MGWILAGGSHGLEPAGGAALHEILWATGVAVVLFLALGVLGAAHRAGRTTLLSRLGAFSSKVSGLPAWAALPSAVAGGALLLAVFGFYWDVATHIDNGRDPGPFANPSHYFIIFGLLGIAVGGYLGALLGAGSESKVAVRIREGWTIPLGCILLMVCGLIALAGFPLDDIWHRLFGQDVTLWGPTHIQMVGGAALSTLALWVLMVEAQRALTPEKRGVRLVRSAEATLAGAFLIGLSALQAEFDYSVPQFRLLFHPVMLAMAAALALVPARARLGRGGAIKAVVFFLLIRGVLAVIVGPGLGHTTLSLPLYIAEAILVELVAWRIPPQRYLTFGVASGVLIGTVGVASEWAWSQVGMTMAWDMALFPEIVLAPVAAIAGGVLGALIARCLDAPEGAPRGPAGIGFATGLVIIGCLAFPLPTSDLDASATVTLDSPESRRTTATVTLDPPDLAEDAEWFNVTSWQGGGSVVAPLVETGPGQYRSDAIPIYGEWKTLIRIHKGPAIIAVPIYLPEDRAIPADEVPAEPQFTRQFVLDKQILLREAKETPQWMSTVAYIVLALIVIFWITSLALGLKRMERNSPLERGRRRHEARRVRLEAR